MYIKVSSVQVFCLILYQGDHHRLVNYSTYVFSIHIWCMEQHVSLWCCTWYGKEVNSENSSTGSLHMSILGLFNHNAVNANVAHTMFLSNSWPLHHVWTPQNRQSLTSGTRLLSWLFTRVWTFQVAWCLCLS